MILQRKRPRSPSPDPNQMSEPELDATELNLVVDEDEAIAMAEGLQYQLIDYVLDKMMEDIAMASQHSWAEDEMDEVEYEV